MCGFEFQSMHRANHQPSDWRCSQLARLASIIYHFDLGRSRTNRERRNAVDPPLLSSHVCSGHANNYKQTGTALGNQFCVHNVMLIGVPWECRHHLCIKMNCHYQFIPLSRTSQGHKGAGGNRDLITPGYAPAGAMITRWALAGPTCF